MHPGISDLEAWIYKCAESEWDVGIIRDTHIACSFFLGYVNITFFSFLISGLSPDDLN